MKRLLLVSMLLFSPVYAAEEGEEPEEYEIEEESCEEEDFCLPKETAYKRHYHCPTGYRYYHRYENRDIDATWPGKTDDSFMEQLMR